MENTPRFFNVGDKVRTSPTGPVGTVVELDPVGLEVGTIIVAWPVKGRSHPVRRAEFAYTINHA